MGCRSPGPSKPGECQGVDGSSGGRGECEKGCRPAAQAGGAWPGREPGRAEGAPSLGRHAGWLWAKDPEDTWGDGTSNRFPRCRNSVHFEYVFWIRSGGPQSTEVSISIQPRDICLSTEQNSGTVLEILMRASGRGCEVMRQVQVTAGRQDGRVLRLPHTQLTHPAGSRAVESESHCWHKGPDPRAGVGPLPTRSQLWVCLLEKLTV